MRKKIHFPDWKMWKKIANIQKRICKWNRYSRHLINYAKNEKKNKWKNVNNSAMKNEQKYSEMESLVPMQ